MIRPPNAYPKWKQRKSGSWRKQFQIIEPKISTTARIVIGPSIGKNDKAEEQEAFVGRVLYDLGVRPEECKDIFSVDFDTLASPGSQKGVKDGRRYLILDSMFKAVEIKLSRLMAIRMRLAVTLKKEEKNADTGN